MLLIDPNSLAIVTIFMEAQGEPFEGKAAVGEVIRTRMRRRYASDGSIIGTVARRFQFSGFNDSKASNDLLIRSLKIDDKDPIVKDCIKAWTTSWSSYFAKDAVLYCNLSSLATPPSWAIPAKFLVKIGQHSFYRD